MNVSLELPARRMGLAVLFSLAMFSLPSAGTPAGAHGRTGGAAVSAPTRAHCAACQMPRMRGWPHQRVRASLKKSGFVLKKVSASAARNETWMHPDGSFVLIHPYGGEKEAVFKRGNNAHLHKYLSDSQALDDNGRATRDERAAHIGLPNPPNLPAVRKRPHGAGSR